MPSRAYTSFLPNVHKYIGFIPERVSMPSRAYTSFLPISHFLQLIHSLVSMPSRAYTSFLLKSNRVSLYWEKGCQCPHGLIPHFYLVHEVPQPELPYVSMPSRAYTSFLQLYTIDTVVNGDDVSMPSRAYTSFLHLKTI